jgi:hypothetical protein
MVCAAFPGAVSARCLGFLVMLMAGVTSAWESAERAAGVQGS